VPLLACIAFALAIGIWFAPVLAGLTAQNRHLFSVLLAAIASVLLGALPLLASIIVAVAIVVLTGTALPVNAFAGFANPCVLPVVVAFLVAQAAIKLGLGRRIVLTDAAIAHAFPSNTARGGVLAIGIIEFRLKRYRLDRVRKRKTSSLEMQQNGSRELPAALFRHRTPSKAF